MSPVPTWGSHQQHRRGGFSTAPNQAWGCTCRVLAQASLHPIFPHIPTALALPGSPAWHSTLSRIHPRHCKPTDDACGNQAPGQWWGWLAQPAPHIPTGQPCPPAPWLKSIIQIILAWRHGSVAVTNSSEARRARAHAPLIAGAGACLLPQLPPLTLRPQPAPTCPGHPVPQIHHPRGHSASG